MSFYQLFYDFFADVIFGGVAGMESVINLFTVIFSVGVVFFIIYGVIWFVVRLVGSIFGGR